jgi:hypothetical protein
MWYKIQNSKFKRYFYLFIYYYMRYLTTDNKIVVLSQLINTFSTESFNLNAHWY